MAYQNVAIVGAGGKMGSFIVKALLASTQPKFTVTALNRPNSNYVAPEDVDSSNLKIVKVDFTDHDALVKSLKGQDAVIISITATKSLKDTSIGVIDAAIEAGVKWVMPSDFGNDESPLLAPFFSSKTEVLNYLQEKADQGKITYNVVRNGPWFDFAIKLVIGFDLKEFKATLYKGNRKFHATTRASVATALVNLLREPSKFANKPLHIHDFFITQSELLEAAESVTGKRFAIEEVDVEELGAKSMEAIKKGEVTLPNMLNVLIWSTWGEDTSDRWDPNDDSASLGIGEGSLTEEVEKLVNASQ